MKSFGNYVRDEKDVTANGTFSPPSLCSHDTWCTVLARGLPKPDLSPQHHQGTLRKEGIEGRVSVWLTLNQGRKVCEQTTSAYSSLPRLHSSGRKEPSAQETRPGSNLRARQQRTE